MIKILSVAFFLFLSTAALGQEVQVVRFPELFKLIENNEKGVKVINFWATWCKPCIEELGYFEELNASYNKNDVEVILVSLDFVEDLDNKVRKFIAKKGLKSKVLLLDETDYNAFIDKISPEWSGAIPATLFVGKDSEKRAFYEKQFKEGELQQALKAFMEMAP